MVDKHGIVRPDFIFFAELPDGSVVADIVDPHGVHLADALPKLKGLAEYAKAHGGSYRRIEAIAEISGRLRVLNLLDQRVQSEISYATDADSIFKGINAQDYPS